jgi:NAD(P)-dependent dehydrogenase (short-subunit alcohol dehydrogenase family)
MRDLTGKIAVVTGASRGLGQRVAIRLGGAGATVALVSRQEAQLRETAGLVAAAGGRSFVLPADVSRAESLDLIKTKVESELGRPSILVNAAGIFGPIQLIKDSDPAAWIETIMAKYDQRLSHEPRFCRRHDRYGMGTHRECDFRRFTA